LVGRQGRQAPSSVTFTYTDRKGRENSLQMADITVTFNGLVNDLCQQNKVDTKRAMKIRTVQPCNFIRTASEVVSQIFSLFHSWLSKHFFHFIILFIIPFLMRFSLPK
jgi:hypothetical protein